MQDIISQDTEVLPEEHLLRRPADVSDARWAWIVTSADKALNGHYAWCTDHEGDELDPGSYCKSEQTTPFGSIVLSSGTTTGQPQIWLDADRVDGHLYELNLTTAACIGSWLERVVLQAQHAPFKPTVTDEAGA